ncbi:MAG: hypothetical protein QXV12_00100 [Candidatus Rehaiarchaeum fermentans]|nr:hypothetical protein [Candidatus Rehaiarchaeum fermentans]
MEKKKNKSLEDLFGPSKTTYDTEHLRFVKKILEGYNIIYIKEYEKAISYVSFDIRGTPSLNFYVEFPLNQEIIILSTVMTNVRSNKIRVYYSPDLLKYNANNNEYKGLSSLDKEYMNTYLSNLNKIHAKNIIFMSKILEKEVEVKDGLKDHLGNDLSKALKEEAERENMRIFSAKKYFLIM